MICMASCGENKSLSHIGAVSDESSSSRVVSVSYEKHYQAWNRDMEGQLSNLQSWVFSDPTLLKPLAEKAHNNVTFLRMKLEENMFVYQILDASSTLLQQYRMKRFSGRSVNDHQTKWLAALKPE